MLLEVSEAFAASFDFINTPYILILKILLND